MYFESREHNADEIEYTSTEVLRRVLYLEEEANLLGSLHCKPCPHLKLLNPDTRSTSESYPSLPRDRLPLQP